MDYLTTFARRLAASALVVALLACAVGCSKKKPPEPVEPPPAEQPKPPPEQPRDTARDRAYWFGHLKSANQKTKQDAMDELAVWVETDPETVAALVEMLKEKTNAGAGKTHPKNVTSTREAAVRVLMDAGPKGEEALREKGLAHLRDGLNDPDAAVREHAAYAVGLLGPLGKPLSGDLVKLCTSPDKNVRGRAFDALRATGIGDATGFARLLTNEEPEVVRLAAELAPTLDDIPAEAVAPLTAALASDDEFVRTSAASALATAGPKAAPAVPALVEAVKNTRAYWGKYDPKTEYDAGPEMAYWSALAASGEAAVGPLAALLAHENALVRGFAAQTLGEIGAPAKAAAENLKAALKDDFGFVAVEAACALIRAGEAKDEAAAVVRRAMGVPNSVAQYAIDAIPRMGDAGKVLVPEALAKLKLRGDAANPYAQFAAVGLVGTLPADEAAKAAADVGALATHSLAEVRRRVGFVLEKLGPAGAPAAEALGAAIPDEKNSGVRDQFVDALVAMGPGAKPALPTLLKLAADPAAEQAQRARLLGAVAAADPASKEVAAILLTAAGDENEDVRAAAAAAMGKLTPPPAEALAKLVALARTDRGTGVRFAALRALVAAGKGASPVRADVAAIAGGKIPEFALLAKVALASMDGDAAKAGADVRAALGDRNAQVRAAAAGSLVVVGPAASDLPALTKLLRDRAAGTREAAANCLAKLGPAAKEAVPQLATLLDDEEVPVRVAAVEALGEFGPAALPAVEKLKELRGAGGAGDRQVAAAARKALDKLGVKEKR
jgi:HEAT repeat protein